MSITRRARTFSKSNGQILEEGMISALEEGAIRDELGGGSSLTLE